MTITTDITTAAAALGRKGGSAKSEAKTEAVRANGAKGGRPAFEWLVIRDGRTPGKYSIWSKCKTEAEAIKLVVQMGKNAMEGHTLAINIAGRSKYGV